MKKVMKYIVVPSVFILGSFAVNVNKANATVRGRSGAGLVRNISCLVRLSSDIKIKVPPRYKAQANALHDNDNVVGVGLRNFNKGVIKNYSEEKWYLQKLNANGDTVTLVANGRPKVTNISGENVEVKYKNENNQDVVVTYKGFPNWHHGKDIMTKLADPGTLTRRPLNATVDDITVIHEGATGGN